MAENKTTTTAASSTPNTTASSAPKTQTVNTEATPTPAAQTRAPETVSPAPSTKPAEASRPADTAAPVANDSNQAEQAKQPEAQETPAPEAKKVMGVYDNTMSRKDRMAVAEKKGIMFLTEEEKEIYKQDADSLAKEEAESEINIKNDDKRKKDDGKPDKFSEDDVIKYMYEKWLIAGVEGAAQKLEKGCGTAYEKLKLWTINKHSEMVAKDKALKESPTFKAQQDIGKLTSKKSEEIGNKYREKKDFAAKTALLLGDGKIFEPENAAHLQDVSAFLTEKHGDKAPEMLEMLKKESEKLKKLQSFKDAVSKAKENKSKSKNDGAEKGAEKDLLEAKKAYEKAKEELGAKDSQTNLCKMGKKYAQNRFDTCIFDNTVEQTAVRMAGANILHAVAADKDALKGKGVEDAYNENFAASLSTLGKATEGDREKYLSYDYDQKRQIYGTYGGAVDVTPQNSMGMIEDARDLSDKALNTERSGIINSKAKEFDKEPVQNKSLDKLREKIKNGIEKNNDLGEEKTPEQTTENDKKKEDKEDEQARIREDKEELTKQKEQSDSTKQIDNLKDEGKQIANADDANKEKFGASKDKLRDNEQRGIEHAEKGKTLFDRPFIAKMKSKNKEQTTAFVEQARQGNVSCPAKGR